MNPSLPPHPGIRWAVVAAFAAGMAWVESAVVLYLRTLVNRLEPHQPDPLPIAGRLGEVELVRELATLIMLLTVGVLAGQHWRQRLGFSAVAFGLWDILYYAFLRVMYGWPRSLGDWDILFLLPLPWWGPVWAPMAIAALMIVWGTLAIMDPGHPGTHPWSGLGAWVLGSAGILLALLVFMADALAVASQGIDAIRRVLPAHFRWAWFLTALVLMAIPVVHQASRLRRPPG